MICFFNISYSLSDTFPPPQEQTPLLWFFLYVFQKQNPLLTNSCTTDPKRPAQHLCGFRATCCRTPAAHEQSILWKSSRTAEFLILRPPGPWWEAAELSNDPIWKSKEKGETSSFSIGYNGDNEIDPSRAKNQDSLSRKKEAVENNFYKLYHHNRIETHWTISSQRCSRLDFSFRFQVTLPCTVTDGYHLVLKFSLLPFRKNLIRKIVLWGREAKNWSPSKERL